MNSEYVEVQAPPAAGSVSFYCRYFQLYDSKRQGLLDAYHEQVTSHFLHISPALCLFLLAMHASYLGCISTQIKLTKLFLFHSASHRLSSPCILFSTNSLWGREYLKTMQPLYIIILSAYSLYNLCHSCLFQSAHFQRLPYG